MISERDVLNSWFTFEVKFSKLLIDSRSGLYTRCMTRHERYERKLYKNGDITSRATENTIKSLKSDFPMYMRTNSKIRMAQ